MTNNGFTFVEIMVIMVIISILAMTGVNTYKKNKFPGNRVESNTSLPGSGYSDYYSDDKLELIVTDGSSLKVLTVTQKLKAAVTVTRGTNDTVIVKW